MVTAQALTNEHLWDPNKKMYFYFTLPAFEESTWETAQVMNGYKDLSQIY